MPLLPLADQMIEHCIAFTRFSFDLIQPRPLQKDVPYAVQLVGSWVLTGVHVPDTQVEKMSKEFSVPIKNNTILPPYVGGKMFFGDGVMITAFVIGVTAIRCGGPWQLGRGSSAYDGWTIKQYTLANLRESALLDAYLPFVDGIRNLGLKNNPLAGVLDLSLAAWQTVDGGRLVARGGAVLKWKKAV